MILSPKCKKVFIPLQLGYPYFVKSLRFHSFPFFSLGQPARTLHAQQPPNLDVHLSKLVVIIPEWHKALQFQFQFPQVFQFELPSSNQTWQHLESYTFHSLFIRVNHRTFSKKAGFSMIFPPSHGWFSQQKILKNPWLARIFHPSRTWTWRTWPLHFLGAQALHGKLVALRRGSFLAGAANLLPRDWGKGGPYFSDEKHGKMMETHRKL